MLLLWLLITRNSKESKEKSFSEEARKRKVFLLSKTFIEYDRLQD